MQAPGTQEKAASQPPPWARRRAERAARAPVAIPGPAGAAGGEDEGIRLAAVGVAFDVGSTRILQPTSLSVGVGELVAVIGPSGAGKSTLLRVLAGIAAPSAGGVVLGEHWVQSRTSDVGYVPFGTLLHDELTLREALTCAARLRLGRTTKDEVDARVADVLEDLRMTAIAEVRIGSLSDGQRRRAACGAELVGRPTMLLLDEPTTGLDVTLERQLMRTLRRLADEGRGVLVSTHTTASLDFCDRVAVMSDSRLRFVGTPEDVREHFAVREIAHVYDVLGDEPAAARSESEPEVRGGWAPVPRPAALPAQVSTLAGRYWRCTLRNRRALLLSLGQAPVIGLAIGLALPERALGDPNLGTYYTMLLAFLLVTGSLWLGLISACREIVRERPIIDREVAAGVRLDAYVVAKCAVLLPMAAVQALLLVVCAAALQPLPGDAGGIGAVLGMCIAVSWAAVGIGLWVSAASGRADHATGAVPLLLIPQLLLAGALVPFGTLSAPIKLASDVMASRWGLAGLGSVLGLDDTGRGGGTLVGSDPSFYADGVSVALAALGVLTVLGAVAAGLTLAARQNR